jgi:hypothetical protein
MDTIAICCHLRRNFHLTPFGLFSSVKGFVGIKEVESELSYSVLLCLRRRGPAPANVFGTPMFAR